MLGRRGMLERVHPWVLCLSLLLAAAIEGPGVRAADPHADVERSYRLERPAEGSGRRGIVSVPSWAVWAAGAAVSMFAASALWRLSRPRRAR
jgi:hypothetical protein